MPEGSVLTVEFELDGHRMLALNGGPVFRLTEAMSIVVPCKDQKEIDRVWAALTKGGEETACGWLKDKYGLSWQVVPEKLSKWIADPDPARAERVMAALLEMKKLDADVLERAYAESAPAKGSPSPKKRGVASPRT